MKRHSCRAAYAAYLGNRLDRSKLVICKHHRYQRRIRAYCRRHVLGADKAVVIGAYIRHLKALALESFSAVQNGVVLDIIRHYMLFSALGKPMCRALYRPVIALGSAGGEIDLRRICIYPFCEHSARVFHCLMRTAPELIQGRGIAVFIEHIRLHCVKRRVGQSGRCRVVGIDIGHISSPIRPQRGPSSYRRIPCRRTLRPRR